MFNTKTRTSKYTNMSDKELKQMWAGTPIEENIQFNHQKFIKDINTANQKFDKKIKWRNIIEIAACIFVIVAFSRIFFIDDNYLVKFGAIVAVITSFYIMYNWLKVQSSSKPNGLYLSIKEQLVHRQTYLKSEQQLLKNIFYWYLLPLVISLTIMTIGAFGLSIFSLIYLCCSAGLCYFLFWLSQKAAKKIDPYIEQIEQAIQQFESITE